MWLTSSRVPRASIISLWVLYFFSSAAVMVRETEKTLRPELA